MQASSLPTSPRVEFYRSEHIQVGGKSIQRHHSVGLNPNRRDSTAPTKT